MKDIKKHGLFNLKIISIIVLLMILVVSCGRHVEKEELIGKWNYYNKDRSKYINYMEIWISDKYILTWYGYARQYEVSEYEIEDNRLVLKTQSKFSGVEGSLIFTINKLKEERMNITIEEFSGKFNRITSIEPKITIEENEHYNELNNRTIIRERAIK